MLDSFSMDYWFDKQIKLVRNPSCTSNQIISIINFKDEDIKWSATLGIELLIQIVSNENTPLEELMSLFSRYSSKVSEINDFNQKNIRNLILKNPNWNIDKVIKILSRNIQNTDSGDEKSFIVGSIADVDLIDDNTEKKIYKSLSNVVDSISCLCEWVNRTMKMEDRKLAENLLNIAPKVNSKSCDYWDYKTLAETTILFMANINKEKDSYEGACQIYNMAISKVSNIEEWNELFDSDYEILKSTVLSNDKCPILIMKDVLNSDNEKLKKILYTKLKPSGFGRFSDPNTGKVIAKMNDGVLSTIE